MSREFDIPENHVTVAGTEYRLLGSAFAAGGQASLYEAVAQNSDVSRRFLIKRFRDSGDYSEEFESEELSQIAAGNVHQAILAAAFHDKKQRTSVMLKASSDCSTVQDILIAWENVPPEDPASEYFDMGRFLESIQIVKSLLGALSGIHKHGVLHTDVSPCNVMWGRTEAHGTAYLLDFSCCTKIGSIVGERRRTTLSFSAPETQIPGAVLTPAADIYSVGAVFLLLVAGMVAANNEEGTVKWSVSELPGEGNYNVTDPVDDLEIPDAYKGKLSEIIIKATTSVDKRYQSASEMLADMVELERIIAGRGMTPETLIRGSTALFRKECDNENGIFHYELQDDLVTEVVDIDSKTPVDILTQNTILLGGGGSGKTTKIRTLWKKCLDEWRGNPKNNPIPVFVPLNTFDSKKSNWDFFIRDYISTVYFPGLSMDVSQRRADLEGMLRSTAKYVLFLDGVNEAVDSSMLNAEIASLAAFKNVTVIITSRNDWGDDETKKLFSTAELMPLNDDLILRKLQENNLGSPSARLLETLQRPMFLALYLRIKITDNAVETPGQILLAHHKHLIDAYKTGHHGEDWELIFELILNDFLPNFVTAIDKLAFETNDARDCLAMLVRKLKKAKNTKYKIEDAQAFLKKVKQPIGKVAIALLTNCGILRKTSRSKLAIAHQNYLEFYQALDVYNQMREYANSSNKLPEVLCKSYLSLAIRKYLGELWQEFAFENKADIASKESPLEQWLQRNTAYKNDRDTQKCIYNIIETMKDARNRHLTAIYDNLDLSLVHFNNCDVSASSFRGSIIPESTFLKWGQRGQITSIAFVPKSSYLVTASYLDSEVILWNFETGIAEMRIKRPNSYKTRCIDVSLDGKLLAVCEDAPSGYIHIYRLSTAERIQSLQILPDGFRPQNIPQAYDGRAEAEIFVRFLANNDLLFAVSQGNRVIQERWSIDSGVCRYHVEYETQSAGTTPQCCFTVTPNREHFLSISRTGDIDVWDLDSGECINSFKLVGATAYKAIALSDSTIAVYSSSEILLLDLETGKCTQYKGNDTPYYIREMVSIGGSIIWRDYDKLIQLDSADGKVLILSLWEPPFHPETVTCLCADKQSGMIGIVTEANNVIVYDPIKEKQRIIFSAAGPSAHRLSGCEVHHISPNLLARFISHNTVDTYSLSEQRIVHQIKNVVYDSIYHAFDGEYYLQESETHDLLQIWNLTTGSLLVSAASDFCFSYEGKLYQDIPVGESFDNTGKWHFDGLCEAKYYPQKKKIAVIQRVGIIKVYDICTRTWFEIGDNKLPIEPITHLRNSEEAWKLLKVRTAAKTCKIIGEHIVAGMFDGRVIVYDLEGRCIMDKKNHKAPVVEVRQLIIPAQCISLAEDGSVCVWDISIGDCIGKSNAVAKSILPFVGYVFYTNCSARKNIPCFSNRLAFHDIEFQGGALCAIFDAYKDGRYRSAVYNSPKTVVAFHYPSEDDASPGIIRIFGLPSHQMIASIDLNTISRDLYAQTHRILKYAVSDSGEWLIVAFSDCSIAIWQIHTQKMLFWEYCSSATVMDSLFNKDDIETQTLYNWLIQNGAKIADPS